MKRAFWMIVGVGIGCRVAGGQAARDAAAEEAGGAGKTGEGEAGTAAWFFGPRSLSPVDAGGGDAQARGGGSPRGEQLLVAGGTFRMGSDVEGEGDERPAHDVAVESFLLDRTEVTQAEYAQCVEAERCPLPDESALSAPGGFRGAERPIVGVSWFDARSYCTWRGKRLPREAEYERAVRGDDGRRFPWGDAIPTHTLTVFATDHPDNVGSRPLGRGPYGHDDLAGNVWEWMEDEYDPFAYRRESRREGRPGTCAEILRAQEELRHAGQQGFTGTNPIPTECERVIRGGAYNYPASGLRSTNRVHHPPKFRLRMTGFRCASDVQKIPRDALGP